MSHRNPAHVVVVGGGASGVLVSARILDATIAGPARITIVEPASRLAAGVAYGTEDPDHLLNVRASGMSADPSLPDDFVEWVVAEGLGDRDTFVARRDYRRYLLDHLERAAASATDGAVDVRRDRVVGVDPRASSCSVRLASGDRLEADHVVLAIGNSAPGVPASLRGLDGVDGWVPDPWSPGALAAVDGAEQVLFVGTGLTMVDLAITLGRTGSADFTGVSRHGLVPQRHLVLQPPLHLDVIDLERDVDDVLALARRIRERIVDRPEEGWRDVIDAIRPFANALWQRYDLDQRRLFLAEVARDWDVHRHRMSPPTAARYDALVDAGRLRIDCGQVLGADVASEGIEVRLETTHGVVTRRFDAVVNCTGPGRSWLSPTENPVVVDLVRRGIAAPDPLELGLDTTLDGSLLGATGEVHPRIHVMGPPRRGTLFESTAVPELRSQALHVADSVMIA